MKKAFKILSVIVVLLILFLVATPFLFKDSIEKLVLKNINNNINATVSWESLDISLLSSFPEAAVKLKNFSVINHAPFKGDTLASGALLELDMGIKQLFNKGKKPIQVDALVLEDALINILVNKRGQANYDIVKKEDAITNEEIATDTENEGSFSLDLQRYEIKNTRVNYHDEQGETYVAITDLNHTGQGDFSTTNLELDTHTTAAITYKMGDSEYFKDTALSLDAVLKIDLENQKYTFLENKALINRLPLTFDGYVQLNEKDTELDISFKTPSSDFKSFLGVIPTTYLKSMEGMTTTGDFSLTGALNGKIDDTYIPKIAIALRSNNASFKYINLPKTVENITLNVDIKNTTGIPKDTYINIGNLTFKIDDRVFAANGLIKHFTQNMLVDLGLKGSIDLAAIKDIIPLEDGQTLSSGIFTADVTTHFDMNAIETEQYQNIRTNGTASLENLMYKGSEFNNPIVITSAKVAMAPGAIELRELQATSGDTDVSATGNIQNLIPFLMSKQDLRGNFNVQSKVFNVNDFMASQTSTAVTTDTKGNRKNTTEASVKLPDFLEATLNFNAAKVIYDNIELKNTQGVAAIKNETASLSNVTSQLFDGTIAIGGNVNTKGNTPTFNMDLDLSKVDIVQTVQQLELFGFLAPIAKSLTGVMSTKINLSGDLTKELTPNLKTITGNALAKIVNADVNTGNTPMLSNLAQKLHFIDLNKLKLQNLDTKVTFKDGALQVQPFDFNVEGIKVTASGSHKIDKSMAYNVNLDVPAKHFGGDVGNLLAKLNPKAGENTTVALPVQIGGSFTKPTVNVNTKAAVNELTQKLIAQQKENLINNGVDAIKDIIPGLGGNNNTPNNNSSTKPNTDKPEDVIKDAVEDVFGGLFGNKNKKDKKKKGN